MTTKTFKLKARGDWGSGKTELLIAFGRIAESFGMITVLSSDGHDMLITSTKEQRCALYEFNRKGAAVLWGAGFLTIDDVRAAEQLPAVGDGMPS
jgi:hypothetical protein